VPTPAPVNTRNPKTPWDFIETQRLELLRLDDDALKSLSSAYETATKKAFRELERVLRQIETALENGEPVHPNWLWRQQRWTALLVQMGEEIERFGGSARDTIDRLGTTAAVMGGEHAATRLSVASPGVSFQMLPREALDMMVANLRARAPAGALLNGIAQTARNELQGAMYRAMRDELTNGVAVGRNPRDVARSIYAKVKNNVDGVTYRRAELIARTESMRMYRGAQTANYRNNDDVVKGWVWVASLNMFTCPACLAKHMSQHPVTEDMHSHPACRCTAMPFVDDEKPDLPFGDDWLKTQPADVQARIMGSPERLRMWKAGEITLADCVKETRHPVWGTNVTVTPIRDLKRVASGEIPSRPNTIWNPNNDPVSVTVPAPPTPTVQPKPKTEPDPKPAPRPDPVTVDNLPRRAPIRNNTPQHLGADVEDAVGFDVMEWATGIVQSSDNANVGGHVAGQQFDRRVQILVETDNVRANRTFFPDQGIVSHDYMKITNEGKGTGARAFASQVQSYRRAGYKKIKTLAARDDGIYNGYYTWARFGFDGDLTGMFWRRKLGDAGLTNVQRVSDLMTTPEGRAWWKEHGETVELEFDLRDGSYSMNVLESYVAERQTRGTFAAWIWSLFDRSKLDEWEHPPRLTRRESAMLDAILDRLARTRRTR
jgi:SPP1 gp7 family putative phage head morphogenesis protein